MEGYFVWQISIFKSFLFCYVIEAPRFLGWNYTIFTPTNAIRFINLSEYISQNIIRKIEVFSVGLVKNDLIEMVRLIS